MRQGDESLVWIVAGGLGSMALGVALIPLRTLTPASNLAFVFLALTIVVAELGGRSAALVTAVVSAISLDFFLTEPYMRITMDKPEDIVAFFALAACGFIAAAFGKRREHWSELAGRADEELDVLKKLVEQLGAGMPLAEVLGGVKRSFGLSAIVLRGEDGRILAAAPLDWAPAVIPVTQLTADSLVPADASRVRFGARGLRLPEGGGRLSFRSNGGSVSIDLWEGDAQGFGLPEGRALTIAASILALELSRRRTA
jgi:K+-sensing histidine kinase KdpD